MSSPTVGAWKALKTGLTNNMLSPKELKESSTLFKSPKYININKSEVLSKPTTSQKQ